LDAIATALADQHAELSSLLSTLEEPDWQRPSRCEGWTVADVMLHLAQTDELAIASVEGRFAEFVGELAGTMGPAGSVDEGADVMVARERDQPATAIRTRWQTSADQLRDQFERCDPHQRVVWVAGELSAQTLATTRLAECWIHTGDVASAMGQPDVATDRLRHIARLAWRTLPYAFARSGRELSGPVAFVLQGPNGAIWEMIPDDEPLTTVRGDALDLCLVAARRVDPHDTTLTSEGPDAEAVLELVRTYA
jgi:uncharacterized protein (TIGR03084 family)